MCLITDKPKQIAAEDITCFKVLSKDDDGMLIPCFYPNSMTYEFDTLYTTNIEFDTVDRCPFTEFNLSDFPEDVGESQAYGPGFHSMSCKFMHRAFKDYISRSLVYKCMIPKGSEYYEDYSGCYVSNQIIIKSLV